MVIFINGSMNSGKTTVGKLLAKRIGYEFLDFDDISEAMADFDLGKDLPKVIKTGIKQINDLVDDGKNVVAVFVVRRKDYEKLIAEVNDEIRFVTLAPRLEVAITNRGNRDLSNWHKERVKYHYKTGIANPDFGIIIDNSSTTPARTAEIICKKLEH
ncbi:MAG: shikimate kinase [bacterium]|nr:shikimate kinase [bacterium]